MTRKNTVRIGALVLCLGIAAVLYFTRYSPSARRATHLARGEQYFQAGDYDKAKLEYMVLLRREPANSIAIERLGSIWLLQGAPAQAMPFLLRRKQTAPDDLANRRKIAASLVELGDLSTARKEAEELLQRAANDDDAWIALANCAAGEQVDAIEKRVQAAGANRPAMRYAMAVLALKKRDLASAERHLGDVLAKDDHFYRAHMAMADLHLLRRNNELANEALKKGSALAPVRSRERIRYPEYRALAGDAAEAKAVITNVMAEAPDYIPAWVLFAKIAVGQKEISEAQAALEKIFSRDPVNYDGRLLEAELQIAKPDFKAAIDSLERLGKVYPGATAVKFQLGRAYALANRPKDAIATLRQAVDANPNYVEAQILLAELNLRAGQPQLVMETLGSLVERQPNLGRAELLLADACRMLKRYDQAVAIYRRHSEVAPKSPLPWIFLGTTYRERGNDSEALAAFEKAIALAPNHLAVLRHLVELDLKRRDFTSASGRLTKLDDKTAASADAKILQARIQGAQQQWTQAEESLLAAIASDPDQSAGYQLLVSLYYEKGRFAEAIKRLEEKLARTPDDISSNLLLARIRDEQKDYEGARVAYEAALRVRPDSIAALNNLAYLYSERLGQLPRALELAQKAHTLQPADPSVADTLGWILYRTGDFDGAVVLLRESASKLAEQGEVPAEVNFHLGMTLMAMGQIDAAQSALTKAAAGSNDFIGKGTIPLRQELLNYTPANPGNLTLERLQALSTSEPADPFVQLRAGEALEAARKFPEAVAAYERALKLNPKLATAVANLARVHVTAVPNPTKAREYAKSARDLAPSDPVIAASLGITVSQLGDHPWAHSLLQQATAQSNPSAESLFALARTAYLLGKTKESRSAYERIVAGADAGPMVERAKTDLRFLRLIDQPSADPTAQQEIATALANDPNALVARVAEAVLMEQRNDWDAAARAYQEILKTYPAFPVAQARLALVRLRAGSWTEAHELAASARKSMPDDPLTALVLGETSFRSKEYRRATDYLAEAARSQPLDGRRLFILGASYFELHDRPRSEQYLKQALEANVQGEDRAEAERMLKQLQG